MLKAWPLTSPRYRRRGGHHCRSKWRAVGIPPRFRFERFQFKEFRFEHGDLSVAARTLCPDVAVVAALADPGRQFLYRHGGRFLQMRHFRCLRLLISATAYRGRLLPSGCQRR